MAQQHLPPVEHLQSLEQPLLEQQEQSLAQAQEALVQHLPSQQPEVLRVEQAAHGAGPVQQEPEVHAPQPTDTGQQGTFATGQQGVHGEAEQGSETHVPPQEFVPVQTGAGQVPHGVGLLGQQPVATQAEPVQTGWQAVVQGAEQPAEWAQPMPQALVGLQVVAGPEQAMPKPQQPI